jgi:hypothetical protein
VSEGHHAQLELVDPFTASHKQYGEPVAHVVGSIEVLVQDLN